MRFDAYVLAGGQSRRMNTDKSLISFGGQPLILRTAELAKNHCQRVVIVGRDYSDQYPQLHFIPDSNSGEGPVAGIIAALKDCRTEACFILPVDLPLLDNYFFEKMYSEYNPEYDLHIPVQENDWHYVSALYSKRALEKITKQVSKGENALKNILPKLKMRKISFAELENTHMFLNLNTPEDLEELRRIENAD